MKNETTGVAIEEFIELKAKRYLYLVNDNSEHKKAKSASRNVFETMSHNAEKDVLFESLLF